MANRIITIGRQFGSGGRTIGKLVAQKLGIPCYDQEIIDEICRESGFTEEFVKDQSEDAPSSSWALTLLSNDRSFYQTTNQDKIWAIEKKLILEIAEKENCVIVGRCADVILDGKADLLKVFVFSDFQKRAERIVDKYGETEVPTEKRLRDKDKRRALFYQFYTDQKWGAMENYHLALDSGTLGIDKCVEIIASLY